MNAEQLAEGLVYSRYLLLPALLLPNLRTNPAWTPWLLPPPYIMRIYEAIPGRQFCFLGITRLLF